MLIIYLTQNFGSWVITLISFITLQLIGQGSNDVILHFLYWTSLIAPCSLVLNETFAVTAAKNKNLSISKKLIINFILCFFYIFMAETQFQEISHFNKGNLFEILFFFLKYLLMDR